MSTEMAGPCIFDHPDAFFILQMQGVMLIRSYDFLPNAYGLIFEGTD